MSTNPATNTGQSRLLERRIKCGAPVISVDCTPSGHVLVAGAVDRSAYVYDDAGGRLTTRLELSDEVWAVATDDSGSVFAAGTASKRPSRGSLVCFDESGEVFFGPVHFDAPVWSVSLSPGAQYLAASTWAGQIHAWGRRGRSYVKLWSHRATAGSAGAYGTRVDDDGALIAALYDVGLLVANLRQPERADVIRLTSGLYNISKPAGGRMYVGRRSGDCCAVDVRRLGRGDASLQFFRPLSDRPICGVASASTGEPVFVGGFDGVLRTLDRDGQPLWEYATPSEIWSVACSAEGRRVFVACGDEHVYVVHNPCAIAEVRELRAAERTLEKRIAPAELDRYVAVAIRTQTFARALRTIRRIIEKNQLPRTKLIESLVHLSSACGEPRAALAAARMLHELNGHEEAIGLLQTIVDRPEIEAEALRLMAQCFDALHLREAARSVYRRVAYTRPDRDGIRLHYDLARSYEDQGKTSLAREHYEFLLSWDVGYRDVYRRLRNVAAAGEPKRRAYEERLDYTGLTVSMLGPDVPRDIEVDPVLLPVLAARAAEFRVPAGDGRRARQALDSMATAAAFHRQAAADLAYEVLDYLRYEQSGPQDDVKKHLEMMNLLAGVSLEDVNTSLDIGTATCRYPLFLDSLGIRSFGIDLSEEGYVYMRNTRKGFDFTRFLKGNGLTLPVRDGMIDLVTCMMGTFNHIPPADRGTLLAEAARVLEFGGVAAFGVWDSECPFQSFLTMYSDAEQEMLRQNGINQSAFVDLARASGFSRVTTVPLTCFPDRLVYDLGLDQVGRHEVERLAAVDFGVRGLHPDWTGQMFLALCKR